jgi:hypothetical protein
MPKISAEPGEPRKPSSPPGHLACLGEGLVGLEHVPADRTEEEERDGEDDRQPARGDRAETLERDRKVAERSSGHGAVLVHLAVLHPQRALDELRAHAEQAGDDHPERGPRAADGDCHTDSGYVPEPDGAGHGRGERLEVGHLSGVAGSGVLAPHQVDRRLEAAELDALEVDREDRRSRDQPEHDQRKRRVPDRRRVKDDGGDGGRDRVEELVDRPLGLTEPGPGGGGVCLGGEDCRVECGSHGQRTQQHGAGPRQALPRSRGRLLLRCCGRCRGGLPRGKRP